jgi:hypothetical protein
VIDLDTLENVSSLIWCALQQMRKALDLPLEPYKQTGGLKPIDAWRMLSRHAPRWAFFVAPTTI